jgi:hypothetical protein
MKVNLFQDVESVILEIHSVVQLAHIKVFPLSNQEINLN